MSISGRVREILIKLLDGILDPGIRADITATLSMLIGRYSAGILGDDKLRKALNELCFDILSSKDPLKDADLVREEAKAWAEKLYHAIRFATMRSRTFISE